MNHRVLLIIPCYNEERRLKADEFFAEMPAFVTPLFANDGSRDGTLERLHALSSRFVKDGRECHVYSAPKNRGKAEVIRGAYMFAKESDLLRKFEWIGFWDADLSTPLVEVVNILDYRNRFCSDKNIIFASRINRFGSKIKRKMIRHYLSRIFVTFTDVILGIKAYDSQCGAKLFTTTVAERAFSDSFVSRWIFDLELILRVGPENIVEVPLQSWEDVAGSKLRIARESFGVLSDLFRIRMKYK